jgi:ABC-type uncharacterized transport system involved in gliding motility auxiliary subunit
MLFKVWLGTNLLLWLATIVVFLGAMEYPKLWGGMFLFATLLSSILGWIKKDRVKIIANNKTYRNFFTHSLRVFLILMILGLVNYLVYKNSRSFDLTTQGLHKLSDQTINVVSAIDKPVKLSLFASRSNWDRYLTIIYMYENLNKNIKVEAIDSETNPQLVKLYEVQAEGTVVLEMGDKKVQGLLKDELNFTNLFIKLLREKKVVIYHTTGHGEVNLDEDGKEGASYLKKVLKQNLFELRPLNLLEVTKIPADADLVMMLGPTYGILDREIKVIKQYLNRGGNLYLSLAPQFTENKVENLHSFIKEYGVRFENGVVVDRLAQMQGTNATIPMVKDFNNKHPATQNFRGRVVYPLTGAFTFEKKENVDIKTLFYSASFPSSWTEMNLEGLRNGNATWDTEDIKGPVSLAVSINDNKHYSKLIVTGSTSYVINGYQNQSPNFNLFLNLVGWLVDEGGITSLNRPGLTDERIFISVGQANLIFYFSICFLPFIFFIMGIYFYRRRLKL